MRDESQLIESAVRGDLGAFETLVRMKRERVVRTAYRITGDLEDARDVAQAVFVTLWRSLDRYDPARRFDTWLYRVTVNAAIDHLRKRGPKGALQALPDDGAGPEFAVPAGAERAVRQDEIRKAFLHLAARLGPKQRAVFVMREIEGLSGSEVARILDVRESTVRNHLHQARRSLREALRREYPGLVPGATDEDAS